MALELRFTVPGQIAQVVSLNQPRMVVGTLLSNHVVLRAPGVEPIHVMIEQTDNGDWSVTDLGSGSGVKINGRPVEVESILKGGDSLTIGAVTLQAVEVQGAVLPPPPPAGFRSTVVGGVKSSSNQPGGSKAPGTAVAMPQTASPGSRSPSGTPVAGSTSPGASPLAGAAGGSQTVRRNEEPDADKRKDEKRDMLFSPRHARPSGDVLEVVAYWGDTILDVEHFAPGLEGFEKVTIGDPTKAHFIAAGDDQISRFVIASVSDRGYTLQLREGMEGRLRKSGKVEKIANSGTFNLSRRDIAHVKYGAVKYFFLFVTPPVIDLPRSGPRDPFLVGLMTVTSLLYMLIVPALALQTPSKKEKDKDDIWSIVNLPEKQKPPEKVKEIPKPKVEIAEVKKLPPPPKTPPPPKPKPPQPAKPVEAEKPKQTEPVKNPVPDPLTVKKELSTLTESKNQNTKQDNKPPTETKVNLAQLNKVVDKGMPSTGAKNPDFKLAGPKTPAPKGAAGGAKGAGMNQTGGEIKGNKASSVMGVEGPQNDKPSGVNLSKLGLGAGKVLSQVAPSAVYTNFKDSAGGAGGGSGSGSRTRGLGGVGSGASLGISGTGTALNNFGSGAGGNGSGDNGSGGLGGAGMGKSFGEGKGKGRANVDVPPGDAVVSGGLTQQEILAVIRANLNQIRHCYEQLLQRSPSANGKVSVSFVVGTDGRVTTANVKDSTISDAMMQSCVTGRITRWKFPEPRGGQPVSVTYPFVFNPI